MCRAEYVVRPTSNFFKGGFGVYEIYDTDRARIVFEGTQDQCYQYLELINAPGYDF